MMPKRESPDCPSNLMLDRLLHRELPDESREQCEAHLSGCPACQERLAAFRAENERFAAQPPPLPAARSASSTRIWLLAPALAAAAGIVGALLWLGPWDTTDEPGGVRTKGKPSMGYFVKRGGEVWRGRDGERLVAGDSVRFVYSVARPSHLAILGRDASRRTSTYFPDGGLMAVVEAGREVALDESAVLDEVTGPEVWYGVFCQERHPLDALRQALGDHPEDPVFPLDCSVDRIRVFKEPKVQP